LGRRIESLFQHTGERSPRIQIVTAVGNYSPFWTHRLTAAAPGPQSSSRRDRFGAASPTCACKLALEPVSPAEASYLRSIVMAQAKPSLEPASAAPYGRALLTRLKEVGPHPFWMVRASDDVVHGHSGIFTTYLLDFLRHVLIETNARARTAS